MNRTDGSVEQNENEVKDTAIEQRRGGRGTSMSLAPRTLGEAIDFSKLVAASELCPKEYRGNPQAVLIAVQMGAEVGIPPMQALQNIAVINGRPSMWGDLVLGLVQASGLLEWINEREPADALAKAEGRCEVKRRGVTEPVVRTFSVEMAEKAGLTSRGGPDAPWARYRGRMLQMRARSWALRDLFADVLKGLQIREEVGDYPPEPEPVRMPRRLSEVKAAPEIAEFTKRGTKTEAAKEAKPTKEAKAAEPSAAPNTWTGRVVAVDEKSGKGWTLYTVRCEGDVAFSTFDAKHARFAREAGKSPVLIEWENRSSKDGSKTYQSIVNIGPHVEGEGREPGSDDDREY